MAAPQPVYADTQPQASRLQAWPQPSRQPSAPRRLPKQEYPSRIYHVPEEDESFPDEQLRQPSAFRPVPDLLPAPSHKSQVFHSFSPQQQALQPGPAARPLASTLNQSSLPPKPAPANPRPPLASALRRDPPSLDTTLTKRDEQPLQSPNRTFTAADQPSQETRSRVYLEHESRTNQTGSLGEHTPQPSRSASNNQTQDLNRTGTLDPSLLRPIERYTRVRRYSYNEFGEKQLISDKEMFDGDADTKSSKVERAVREVRGDSLPKPILKKPPTAPTHTALPRETTVSRLHREQARPLSPQRSQISRPQQPATWAMPRERQIHFATPARDDSSSNSSFTNDYELRAETQKETLELSDGGIVTTYVIEHPPKHMPELKTWISQGVQVDTITPKPEQPPPAEVPPLRSYMLPRELVTYEQQPPSPEPVLPHKSPRISSSASGLDASSHGRKEASLLQDPPSNPKPQTPTPAETPKFTPTVRRIKKEPVEHREPSPIAESKFADPTRFNHMRVGDVIEKVYFLNDNGDVEQELFRKTDISVRKEKRLVASRGELQGTFRQGGLDLDAPIKNRPGKLVRDFVSRMPNAALSEDPSVRKRVETSHVVLPPQETFRKSQVIAAEPRDHLYDSFQHDSREGEQMHQFMRDDESDENAARLARNRQPLSGRPNKDSSSEATHFMMTNPNSRPASAHSGPRYAQADGEATPGFKAPRNDPQANFSQDRSQPGSFSQAAQDAQRMTFSGQRPEPAQPAPQEKKEPIRMRFQLIDGKRIPIAIDNENLSEKEKNIILENYVKKEGFTMAQIEELLNKGQGRAASPQPASQLAGKNQPSMSNLPISNAPSQANLRQQANQSGFPSPKPDPRPSPSNQQPQMRQQQPDNSRQFSQQQFESIGVNEENSFGNSRQYTSNPPREDPKPATQPAFFGQSAPQRDHREDGYRQGQPEPLPEFEKKTGITESNLSGNGYPGPPPDRHDPGPQRSQSPPARRPEDWDGQPSSPTLHSSKASDGRPKITVSPPQTHGPPAYSLSKLTSTKKAQQKMQLDLGKTESLPFQIEEEDDEHRSGIRGPTRNQASRVAGSRQPEPDPRQQRQAFGLDSHVSGTAASSLPRGRNDFYEQSDASAYPQQLHAPARDPDRVKFESQMSSNLYDHRDPAENFELGQPQLTRVVSNNQTGTPRSPGHSAFQKARPQSAQAQSNFGASHVSARGGGRQPVGFSAFGSIEEVRPAHPVEPAGPRRRRLRSLH